MALQDVPETVKERIRARMIKAIGPNLAAMRSRGAEAILTNVLDPNREVNPQYLNYIVQTRSGRSLSGMIASESASVQGAIATSNKNNSGAPRPSAASFTRRSRAFTPRA